MKIISNFKDYYDFQVGLFGLDESIVYDRNTAFFDKKTWIKRRYIEPQFRDFEMRAFAIAGKIYAVCFNKGVFVPMEEVRDIIEQKSKAERWFNQYTYKYLIHYHLSETNLNEKFDCPVIELDYQRNSFPLHNTLTFSAAVLNPCLSFFHLFKVLPPEEIWVSIVNFLTRDKPFIDTRSNNEKVISNGFNLKTSFRKK
jgi:hypothetical protein